MSKKRKIDAFAPPKKCQNTALHEVFEAEYIADDYNFAYTYVRKRNFYDTNDRCLKALFLQNFCVARILVAPLLHKKISVKHLV